MPFDFTNYLDPPGLGPLQITAYDLSFNNPTTGYALGTATYIVPTTAAAPTAPVLNPGVGFGLTSPQYAAGTGIIQQTDVQPFALLGWLEVDSGYFTLESVATAVIPVATTPVFENLKLVAQWGTGPAATAIPVAMTYYDVPLGSGAVPDLNSWAPDAFSSSVQSDLWSSLAPSLYLQLPPPPTASNPLSFQLPADGSPPPFDVMLKAVQAILTDDPGVAVVLPTNAAAAAASTSLSFASLAGVSVGMTMTGAGVPDGTVVTAITGGTATFNQELSQATLAGEAITFSANIAGLTFAQCQNIAYEITWSQQQGLPKPPDPIENLYSNPPNNGALLTGGSSSQPNQYEGDRQQFEAQLKSYYAVADTNAGRLTNFVYALSTAVACELQSITAEAVMLELPVDPGQDSPAPLSQTSIILTGVSQAGSMGNFGVPAAYFYALAATMPVQVTLQQRYQMATGAELTRLLTDLTTAVNAGTVSDAEAFATIPAAKTTAAQAARRISALGVPPGSATPLAPLGAVQFALTATVASGDTLPVAASTIVTAGMTVSGPEIAAGTTVSAVGTISLTLSAPVLDAVASDTSITFTPAYSAELKSLVQEWLAYPPAVQGVPSSQDYQPVDDLANFWPKAAETYPAAFLSLVLSSLTQDYVLPAPFSVSLGQEITTFLDAITSPPTVSTLASVTVQQWTSFFAANPTWLPPFTQPGNTTARISTFIRYVQQFFAVGTDGPPSEIDLATTAATAGGGSSLEFAATSSLVQGMAVSGVQIAPGTTISAALVLTATSTTVLLSQAVTANVPIGTNIIFAPSVDGSGGQDFPELPRPYTDLIGLCLGAYGAFVFGAGLDPVKLAAAAAIAAPGDADAQAWLIQALTTLDALYAVMKPVALSPATTPALVFSVVEALYARGFTSAESIAALSPADFQRAVLGSIAYDPSSAIYAAATAIAGSAGPGGASGPFQPVNDGTLTNCIPSPCASPLDPIAYLHEMLQVSELSTCADPERTDITLTTNTAAAAGDETLWFAATTGMLVGMSASGAGLAADTTVTAVYPTSIALSAALTANAPSGTSIGFAASSLADILATRRGPVGDLAASCANLETPLPLIDLVNECLEAMASAADPTAGVVYDTAADALDGLELCQEEPCSPDADERGCHDPAALFGAMPEFSTPASPDPATSTVEPAAFNALKTDFSSCLLPYSQALDVSRTYLKHFRTCRFEEMRTFRKCITEFVLDPTNEPAHFEDYLWRYPVRIDIAMEYLGVTPEEYVAIFQGAPAPVCGPVTQPQPSPPQPPSPQPQPPPSPPPPHIAVTQAPRNAIGIRQGVISLPEFLQATCLSYCEFYDAWQCGFVAFSNGADRKAGIFPQCEPCCLDELWLQFGDQNQGQDYARLTVFIRLWRKLRASCCFCYSFAELRDICDVLHLFQGGAVNPDFIRQLAAFQMLRDDFQVPLVHPGAPPAPGAVDADRTQLLSLWVGPGAAKWSWAVEELIANIELFAQRRHGCRRREPEFVKTLGDNLDVLSKLGGFDPTSATGNWHAAPTHTLRYAEVLAKIYASDFSLGEIVYLFTVDDHLDGDDPFPLQDNNEALDWPLELPDDEHGLSLARLRGELLDVRADDDEAEAWPWRRIETALEGEFGYPLGDIQSLGRHFFPSVAGGGGRFVSNLPAAQTTPQTWNSPPDGPFQYDAVAGQLSCAVPLSDRAVMHKLMHVHDLDAAEQQAVQDLVFQPRALLAGFAMLFSDFAEAGQRLIGEPDEQERWAYFRRQFVVARQRSWIIARHLTRHVAAATGRELPASEAAALLVLRSLYADENTAPAGWESDGGSTPAVTWSPPPRGGAFAALLGLAGCGLTAEYKSAAGNIVWRDASGPLSGFGRERDRENCPVPTVLPSFGATLTAQQSQFATIHNGFLMKDANGEWLGGGEAFQVVWTGALLIEHEGTYEFWGGAPTDGDERPDFEAAHGRQWRATLKRAQRSWTILSRHWAGEEDRRASALPLRRGAYEITVELAQDGPHFTSDEAVHRGHTGLQVKYAGPDSEDRRIDLPHSRLIPVAKRAVLADGIANLSPGAGDYLNGLYVSSLRDIRRTYQRAFKALLFTHRFALSAERRPHGTSELGFVLDHPANFAGSSYYVSGGGYVRRLVDFDFNFLPLADTYHSPVGDARAAPSAQQSQAMFDWWERIFDYCAARREVHRRCDRRLWHLFDEAADKQPAHPGHLLRHMGADSRHWSIDLRYFQNPLGPVYEVSSADLEDDRWVVRIWRADRWVAALQRNFAAKDITLARPDLWASDDPSAIVPGETETGNANLSTFILAGCVDNGEPRRYADIMRLNDGLRERGRDALVAYLCSQTRVLLPWLPGSYATAPRDLSDLLLIDVEAGVRERASRIDQAISAAQAFVRRARLGLEPSWTVTREFARLWDRQFATFRDWQACKRRELYKENWIEWKELDKARHVEAFRFLEDKLKAADLTLAEPGSLAWWPPAPAPAHNGLELLQEAMPSSLGLLAKPREGLNLMGTPEWAASPSWLVPTASASASSSARAEAPAQTVPTPGPAGSGDVSLPYWLEAAIGLGTRFCRVAAAGLPPGSARFKPYPQPNAEDCGDCCAECGSHHPTLVDEYYFWLVDGEEFQPPVTPTPTGYGGLPPLSPEEGYQVGYQTDYYDPGQQEAALWQDPSQLPNLLDWQPTPVVRLAWTRVHNGQFQQPRESLFAVGVEPGKTADLVFLGRTADSLTFSVTNGVIPEGYADPSEPGFRYDLATDEATTLPEVKVPSVPTPYESLPSYPYFLHDAPGAPLFPLSPFSPALAVARALRSRCRFEEALGWYRLAFDPLSDDCTWIDCGDFGRSANDPGPVNEPSVREGEGRDPQGACCDATDIDCDQARNRAVLLQYLETLVEWADAIRRRGNSPEAFEQARVIFDAARLILGRRPRNVQLAAPASPPTVADFVPAYPPLNPRLLDIYDVVEDRLALIRATIDARRLRGLPRAGGEVYFANDPVREGWRTNIDPCADGSDWCFLPSPYRFTFLLQKAQDYATRVEQLGGALLSAFEKGDAEYLASLRADQELGLLNLGMESRKDQWRDADWQIEVLQSAKAVDQANLTYYNSLINSGPGGLIDGEIQYQNQTASAISLRGTANITEGIGEAMRLIPDIVLGAAGFGGSPVSIAWIPLGTKIGDALEATARLINNAAEIDSITGGLDNTNASWERRLTEWMHQSQVLKIQIQQAERQILGAQRRRDQTLHDLNALQRQIEQSTEALDFLRGKFTAHDLYLFLQKETLALYHRSYDLALHAARQAQHAFNVERGHTTRHFLPDCDWDDLHQGLLAGERLSAALRHMDKAYCDENVREYELAKTFSLRLHFPMGFLKLRTTGCCEIEIPEWMYDLDHPGHYMRRIKNVALTIPCVAGSFTGVHCRLTLLDSTTRIDPRLRAPIHACCCPPEPCGCGCDHAEQAGRDYELCPDDPRRVRQFDARQAIATSTGQNDTGLFQLNFEDTRYLPFEFHGAVSRWRIELPMENNDFDFDTLSDCMLRVNFTSREGGHLLRAAARECASRRLPGDGWRVFDIRHECPDAWQVFMNARRVESPRPRPLKLRLDRRLFPFVPGGCELSVSTISVLFGGDPCCEVEGPPAFGCPCPEPQMDAYRDIAFAHEHDGRPRGEQEIRCFASEAWPHLYTGMFKAAIGPLANDRGRTEIEFRLPEDDIRHVFLLCRYEVKRRHHVHFCAAR